MGDFTVNSIGNIASRNDFVRNLLTDVEALELMYHKNLFEEDKMRIGAEQEFFLVDDHWRPFYKSDLILKALNDPHFTNEMTLYTLEINLDPLELKDGCFNAMEQQLKKLLQKVNAVAHQHHAKTLLTGILPTISKKDLQLKYMTPFTRYQALNDNTKKLRGADFNLHIKGVDELTVLHDTIMFEGCNASFQMHLQIPPHDFIASYNWAQTIAAPLLAISTNSPLLMGRELWSESRIALFQQSVDTRAISYSIHDKESRVSFGNRWAKGSVADIFKSDITKHKVLLTKEVNSNSMEILKAGQIPALEALKVHNSTMYHWNRACYGVSDGKPHLRIENRYLPAGPTTTDEMANFAFWVGLMVGRPKEFDAMPTVMDFKDVKSNFLKAARTGKETVLLWKGELLSVEELVIKKLLPIALAGLTKLNINPLTIEKYLNIIEARTIGQSGSQWQVKSFHNMLKSLKKDDALVLLTQNIYENQMKSMTVEKWPEISSSETLLHKEKKVAHVMSTQLLVVEEHDLADLATSIMLWNNIHHLPVENAAGELVGLLTWTHLKNNHLQDKKENYKVSDIMVRNPLTVHPDTSIKEAIKEMKAHVFGCLPVIETGVLVGIITIKDVIAYSHDQTAS